MSRFLDSSDLLSQWAKTHDTRHLIHNNQIMKITSSSHPFLVCASAIDNNVEIFKNTNHSLRRVLDGHITQRKTFCEEVCYIIQFDSTKYLMKDEVDFDDENAFKTFVELCLHHVLDALIVKLDEVKNFHWGKFFRCLEQHQVFKGIVFPFVEKYFIESWNFDPKKVKDTFLQPGSFEPSAKPIKIHKKRGFGGAGGVQFSNRYDRLQSRWSSDEWLTRMRDASAKIETSEVDEELEAESDEALEVPAESNSASEPESVAQVVDEPAESWESLCE